MKAKDFFKPTTGKIILTVVLFIIIFLLMKNLRAGVCYEMIGPNGESAYCPLIPLNERIVYSSVLIPIWYLISCAIIFLYDKVKNKK